MSSVDINVQRAQAKTTEEKLSAAYSELGVIEMTPIVKNDSARPAKADASEDKSKAVVPSDVKEKSKRELRRIEYMRNKDKVKDTPKIVKQERSVVFTPSPVALVSTAAPVAKTPSSGVVTSSNSSQPPVLNGTLPPKFVRSLAVNRLGTINKLQERIRSYKIDVPADMYDAHDDIVRYLRPSAFRRVDDRPNCHLEREHAVDNSFIRPYCRRVAISEIVDLSASIERPRVLDMYGSLENYELVSTLLPELEWVFHHTSITSKDKARERLMGLDNTYVVPSKIGMPCVGSVCCNIAPFLTREYFSTILIQDVQQACASRAAITEYVRRGLSVVVILHCMNGFMGSSGYNGYFVKTGDGYRNYAHLGRDYLPYIDSQSCEWMFESDGDQVMLWSGKHIYNNVYVVTFVANDNNCRHVKRDLVVEVQEVEFSLLNRQSFWPWFRRPGLGDNVYTDSLGGAASSKQLVHYKIANKVAVNFCSKSTLERIGRDLYRDVVTEVSKLPYYHDLCATHPLEASRLMVGTGIYAERIACDNFYKFVEGIQQGNEKRGLSISWLRNSQVTNSMFNGWNRYLWGLLFLLIFIPLVRFCGLTWFFRAWIHATDFTLVVGWYFGYIQFLLVIASFSVVIWYCHSHREMIRRHAYRITRRHFPMFVPFFPEDLSYIEEGNSMYTGYFDRSDPFPTFEGTRVLDLGSLKVKRAVVTVEPAAREDWDEHLEDCDVKVDGVFSKIDEEGRLCYVADQSEPEQFVYLIGPVFAPNNYIHTDANYQHLLNDMVLAQPYDPEEQSGMLEYWGLGFDRFVENNDGVIEIDFERNMEWCRNSAKSTLYTRVLHETRHYMFSDFEQRNRKTIMSPKHNEASPKTPMKVRSISAPDTSIVVYVGPYVDEVFKRFKQQYARITDFYCEIMPYRDELQPSLLTPVVNFYGHYGGCFDHPTIPDDVCLGYVWQSMMQLAPGDWHSVVAGDDGVEACCLYTTVDGKRVALDVFMETDMTSFDRTVSSRMLHRRYAAMRAYGCPSEIIDLLMQSCSNTIECRGKNGFKVSVNQRACPRQRSGTSDTSCGNSITRLDVDRMASRFLFYFMYDLEFESEEDARDMFCAAYKRFMQKLGFIVKPILRPSILHCTFLKGNVLECTSESGMHLRWIPSFAKIVKMGAIRDDLSTFREGIYGKFKGKTALYNRQKLRLSEVLNGYRHYTNMPLVTSLAKAYPKQSETIYRTSFYTTRAKEDVTVLDWEPMLYIYDLEPSELDELEAILSSHKPGVFIDHAVFRKLGREYGFNDS